MADARCCARRSSRSPTRSRTGSRTTATRSFRGAAAVCSSSREAPATSADVAAAFLRLGSWIGGDRDGNPHVDADTLRAALGRAVGRRVRALPRRGPPLGARTVALDALLDATVGTTRALARARARRVAAPRRRAVSARLTGVYARCRRPRVRSGSTSRMRAALGDAAPYATAERVRRRSRTSSPSSLAAHGAARLAAAAPDAAASRGVRVRLPPRDARPAPELRRARGGRRRAPRARGGLPPTTPARRERRGSQLLARELGMRARCSRRTSTYSERTATRARDRSTQPPRTAPPLRRRGDRRTTSSRKCRVGVRPARSRRAAEGSRPAAPATSCAAAH